MTEDWRVEAMHAIGWGFIVFVIVLGMAVHEWGKAGYPGLCGVK